MSQRQGNFCFMPWTPNFCWNLLVCINVYIFSLQTIKLVSAVYGRSKNIGCLKGRDDTEEEVNPTEVCWGKVKPSIKEE